MTKRLALAGCPDAEVILRRSGRARRLSLRVSRLDGRVTLTAPSFVPMREVTAFLEDRTEWVRGHLASQPAQVRVGPGVAVPVQGVALTVTAAEGHPRRATRDGARLIVDADRAGAQVQAWLREAARERLSTACEGYAAKLGRPYSELVLRDTRSRWGSCSTYGRLMFSWRLIMAPARILEYVAAHEVAHLAEMNHGPQFWDEVTRLHPTWEVDRGWLHEHGAWLHRYRFEGERG